MGHEGKPMCDTNLHARDDDALVALTAADLANPAVFEAVRGHRYRDECCRVELGGDMKVRFKNGYSAWHAYGGMTSPTWATSPSL